jgi:hypothetical protein
VPTLAPCEQAEHLRQIVTRIDYDGISRQVAIRLRSSPLTEEGIRYLCRVRVATPRAAIMYAHRGRAPTTAQLNSEKSASKAAHPRGVLPAESRLYSCRHSLRRYSSLIFTSASYALLF